MKIKSIEWRNFGSYGNKTQCISFEESNSNLYLILGANGSGKSTLSDVIKYSLYGKLDSKKKGDIPNRFNGNMYVKITIEIDHVETVIERGISPGLFKIYVNGIEYEQAGKRNMQEYLEEEILGIPYYVFSNMISLSINDFKSFISMTPNDKRQIVDRLFGLEILNHVNSKIKAQLKTLKESIDSIDIEISVLNRSVESSVNELDILNECLKNVNEEKKQKMLEEKEKYTQLIQKATEKIKELDDKEQKIVSQIREWNEVFSKQKIENHSCEEKIILYKSGKCPMCESDLTTENHHSALEEYIKRNESTKKTMVEIETSLNDYKEKRKKIGDVKLDIITKRGTAESRINQISREVKKLEVNQNDYQTESLKNIIRESETKRTEAIEKKDLEDKKIGFYKIIEDVFSSKGIKMFAIKKILPLLNSEIKRVLIDLNMEYKVSFDEEFEVKIQHLGFDITPEQLSTGERKKVDFATLIALIRLMKLKFSGLNLIFLDEVFSSIDSDGIYHILNVLKKSCKELNLNIFVINHSPLPVEIFDYKIEIVKNNNFSNMSLEKIV